MRWDEAGGLALLSFTAGMLVGFGEFGTALIGVWLACAVVVVLLAVRWMERNT